MNREISEIILRSDGKLRCLFNPQDPIYLLSDETTLMPSDEQKQQNARQQIDTQGSIMCNTCCSVIASAKKIKYCQFCAQGNCAQCQYKTRPYPKNNPEKTRRGAICLQCDKKFLYRDALHENQIKLGLRDTNTQQNFDKLVDYEHKYELTVAQLNQVNQQRHSQVIKFQRHIKELEHLVQKYKDEL